MTPSPRNPQVDPQAGDVLLETGQDHPLVVGEVTDDPDTGRPEVMYGYGDHKYYFLSLKKWRDRHMNGRSRVIHTKSEPNAVTLLHPDKCCVECGHFYLQTQTEDFSEVTPGTDFAMWCDAKKWEYSPYDTEEEYRACILAAKTCPEFSERTV